MAQINAFFLVGLEVQAATYIKKWEIIDPKSQTKTLNAHQLTDDNAM